MTGQRGKTFEAVLRGSNLADAQALLFDGEGVETRILSVNPEPPVDGEEAPKDRSKEPSKDLLEVRITLSAEAPLGPRDFRVITPRGVSNKLALHVTAEPVLSETDAALPLKRFPVVINGRIAHPGDTNSWSIEVTGGETLTFEASSFANGFDPSVTLYEPTGSWFDRAPAEPGSIQR